MFLKIYTSHTFSDLNALYHFYNIWLFMNFISKFIYKLRLSNVIKPITELSYLLYIYICTTKEALCPIFLTNNERFDQYITGYQIFKYCSIFINPIGVNIDSKKRELPLHDFLIVEAITPFHNADGGT